MVKASDSLLRSARAMTDRKRLAAQFFGKCDLAFVSKEELLNKFFEFVQLIDELQIKIFRLNPNDPLFFNCTRKQLAALYRKAYPKENG